MKIPDEFIHIANSFHQDTLTIHKTLDDAINECVLGLNETEIRTAKDYLDLIFERKLFKRRVSEDMEQHACFFWRFWYGGRTR